MLGLALAPLQPPLLGLVGEPADPVHQVAVAVVGRHHLAGHGEDGAVEADVLGLERDEAVGVEFAGQARQSRRALRGERVVDRFAGEVADLAAVHPRVGGVDGDDVAVARLDDRDPARGALETERPERLQLAGLDARCVVEDRHSASDLPIGYPY